MGKTIVLDTNILFEFWTKRKDFAAKFPDIENKKLCITIFTYMEFLASTPARHKITTRKFLHRFEIVPFGPTAMQAAKTLSFTKVTAPANYIDLLIQSNVNGLSATLITFNQKDFDRFE